MIPASLLLGLLLLHPATGLAQTPLDGRPGQAAASPFTLIPVPQDQTRLEESSLIPQAEAFGSAQSQTLPGSRPVGENSRMTERTEDVPNALRCYGFRLEPGETLRLRLKGKSRGAICMKFLPKAPPDAMTAQVRRANMAPAPLRQSRIEITNTTPGPYLVALMLYGQPNEPYVLEIERKR